MALSSYGASQNWWRRGRTIIYLKQHVSEAKVICKRVAQRGKPQ